MSAARFTRCDLKVVRAQGKSRIMAGERREVAARETAIICSRLYCGVVSDPTRTIRWGTGVIRFFCAYKRLKTHGEHTESVRSHARAGD